MIKRIGNVLGMLTATVLVLLVMSSFVAGLWPRPKSVSQPSKLEKTCFVQGPEEGLGDWMPCFIADEGRRPEWQI